MPVRSITFWYNAPTVHQFGLIRALATSRRNQVAVATFADLLPSRRRMGWEDPNFGLAERVRLRPGEFDALIAARSTAHDLHLFSGIRAFQNVYAAFRAAVRTDARIGIIAIRPDPRGVVGALRRIRYRLDARHFRERIDVFLALGATGVQWYTHAGYPKQRVYEFGNFSERPRNLLTADRHARFRVIFVGSLLDLKGVDVLLRALGELRHRTWQLRVVGDGPARARLMELASELGLSERVEWPGFLPHERIYGELASADVAVLPSWQDGWGSVVNESVLCGTPVICSDACGAAASIAGSGAGAIFPSGGVRELRDTLAARMDRGAPTPDERDAIAEWAECLTPSRGAAYLESIIAHAVDGAPRPVPPWAQHAQLEI